MFAVANPEAYKILSTAEGLFGYGQGLYYTYQKTKDINSDSIEIISNSGKYYSEGQKINESQEDIAK
jgi:hypothetical protein